MLKRLILAVTAIVLTQSCEQTKEETINKFSDPTIVKIYEYKDRRLSDSLYQYFNSPSISIKTEAILAFGSIQDTTAIDQLGKLLTREADTTARKAIAFAIGQTPSQKSERILLGAIMNEKNPEVLKELLEAYGRSTTHWQLIQPSFVEDTIKAQGLAWSIYRAGLKNKADTAANRVAGILVHQRHHHLTQMAAAHYYARSASNFEKQFSIIADIAKQDESSEVRMAAVYALRKINTPSSLEIIKSVLQNDKDERVRINAVRALQTFPFDDVKSLLYNALYDKNVNIAIAASEVIRDKGTVENWIELSNLTGRITQWRVRANIYEGALKASQNEALRKELIDLFNQSRNPYEQAWLLAALQSDIKSFDFLTEQLSKADTPVVRTSAASALAALHKTGKFKEELKKKYVEVFQNAVQLNDPAVLGVLASPLGDKANNYKSVLKDASILNEAKQKLSLPRDNESLQPIEAAIAYLEDKQPASVSNQFNNPIDWNFVKTIPKEQRVVIKTSKGHITIQLLVEEAPGSVANFLKLAQANYFDNKLFHRVVPNFVIQAGCNRGDGYGSEDYSIRSEFSHRRYKTGSVGMASAGKDTEGTQWFITHSPTPHLDGRYTIFAEVVEGMNIVNLIEVGDQILDVDILKQ